jgi:hypothetical protein
MTISGLLESDEKLLRTVPSREIESIMPGWNIGEAAFLFGTGELKT